MTKRYDEKAIRALLEKFMDGTTTLEEEATLTEYFRETKETPADLRDYQTMFAYFESRMKEKKRPRRNAILRWAAAILALTAFGILWNAGPKKPATPEPSAENEVALTIENKKEEPERPAPQPEQEAKAVKLVAQSGKPDITEPDIDERTAEEIDRRMRIIQARIDSEIAAQTAELYIAEYHAQQIANGEEAQLPAMETTLGDGHIPMPSIMTLVMP